MLFHTIPKHTDYSIDSLRYEELNQMLLADIIEICRERNLPTEGTKSQLISDLLFWKENTTRLVPAPSTPRLNEFEISQYTSSTSNASAMKNERETLRSREFSVLFLNGETDTGLDIPYKELVIKQKIGSGGFKDCYEGVYKGEAVAIGELRITRFNEINLAEIKHEINVLKQLRHENVVKFIGVCTHPSHLCIVTELCSKGDLFDVIRAYPRPSFAQQVMYMYDIALGVAYLHTRRPSIIHRDLKSMNILVSSDDRAKINDFGLARIRPRANALMHTQCGTPNWQAPEFWSVNPSYTEKVDVYACGLIFWEIMTWGTCGYPYQDYSEHELYEAVKYHDARPPISQLTNIYPRNLLVLIMEMWETNPSLRPSMNHVVERLSTYLT
ncbi:kinase-like protein [Rhizopus microsporus var. microsporus]|uniref:Kinase-like protein n=1 Tax=Rhizopus microsporus var. microsporus TaxID=86635 RepID=A0A1X0R6B0_RHIZD|nr:kinase-like protein [Rhizopus microsporus var. microsporus]